MDQQTQNLEYPRDNDNRKLVLLLGLSLESLSTCHGPTVTIDLACSRKGHVGSGDMLGHE